MSHEAVEHPRWVTRPPNRGGRDDRPKRGGRDDRPNKPDGASALCGQDPEWSCCTTRGVVCELTRRLVSCRRTQVRCARSTRWTRRRTRSEVKHSKRSSLCRSCFIVSTASVLLGVLSFFRAVSFCIYLCVLASSECARVDGAKRHQREPFQWGCDGSDIIFIEVRHIPTGMVRYDDRSAQAIHLRFHWHGRTYSSGKLEYRSFAYDRRSTDAPKAEVPRSLWNQKISQNK